VKLKAIIGETEEELALELNGGRVSARIGTRVYELEAREIEPGGYLLFWEGQVLECRVGKNGVLLGGQTYPVKIIDPRRLRSGQNSGGQHHGVAQIIAPMPGKVVKVQVAAGATVEKGAGVIVVEAMKMQNEMKSPRTGTVVSINVAPGDTVNAGDVLAVLD
jgi:acetyl/propionyl-CoA carboxylase alpha subunit